MTKYVFIGNTQLHLLIAQSIIIELKLTNCYLISYVKDKLNTSLLFDLSLWQQIYELPSINKAKAYQFKRKVKYLNSLKSATLFWGNDYQLENQVVAHIIKPEQVFLFDDGVASYIDNIRKVRGHKRVAMQFYSYAFLGGTLKNLAGIGHYGFNGRYCLSKQLMLNDDSAKAINLSFSSSVAGEVSAVFAEENIIKPTGLLLTQPITEYNGLTLDEENAHLIKLAKQADKLDIATLIVKSHPGEAEQRCEERLNIIKKHTNAKVLVLPRLNSLPIEVITSGEINCQFECALSVYSTALLTLKLLQDDLCCISSLSESDAQKNEAFSQLYTMFKKFKIQEVSSERVL